MYTYNSYIYITIYNIYIYYKYLSFGLPRQDVGDARSRELWSWRGDCASCPNWWLQVASGLLIMENQPWLDGKSMQIPYTSW